MVKMAIWCDKQTCFAWNKVTHGCGVLNDTNFIGRDCPFFKTRAALKKEYEALMARQDRGMATREEAGADEGRKA